MTKSRTGILVAKLILAGDVHMARKEAATCRGWSVPEARAIAGACRVAKTRGLPVEFEQFCH